MMMLGPVSFQVFNSNVLALLMFSSFDDGIWGPFFGLVCQYLSFKKLGPFEMSLYVLSGRKDFNKDLQKSGKVAALEVISWESLRSKTFAGKDRNFAIEESILHQLAYSKGPAELKSKIEKMA